MRNMHYYFTQAHKTFSPSSKCTASYFETQRPTIDYLTHQLCWEPTDLKPLPSGKQGEFYILFNDSVFCFVNQCC